MDKNTKLAQYILDAIAANAVFFTGSCGVVNNDGTVNVKRENGISVNAIAANITGSGDCAVFKVQGEYYAFSTVVNKVEKEAIAINRRSKKKEITEYPIKVLFAVYSSDGKTIDIYVGGDRLKSKKVYTLNREGLIFITPVNYGFFSSTNFGYVVGGLTNLGQEEIILIATQTATSHTQILIKGGKTKQIDFVNPSGTVASDHALASVESLGNGAYLFANLKLIYDFDEKLFAEPTATYNTVSDAFGNQLETTTYNTVQQSWTPDRFFTDIIAVREFVSSSVVEAGVAHSIFNIQEQGYFIFQNTINGYITQDYSFSSKMREVSYLDTARASSVSYIEKNEERNIITYFRLNKTPIILNTSDFFAIRLVSSEGITTKDSKTITVFSTGVEKNGNISGKVLLFWYITEENGYKEVLIKGTVSQFSSTPTQLSVSIDISSITPYTGITTSFLVSDNGSFYSYYFFKKITNQRLLYTTFVDKTVVPQIILTRNSVEDNIFSNRIYSIVWIDEKNGKITVEEWVISENGNVTWNRSFKVDSYVKIARRENSFGLKIGMEFPDQLIGFYSYHRK